MVGALRCPPHTHQAAPHTHGPIPLTWPVLLVPCERAPESARLGTTWNCDWLSVLSSGGERPVHWSSLGAGAEGCCRESPPNFGYQPPPLRTNLWHRTKKKKTTTLIPLCESFQVGWKGGGRGRTVLRGGGVEERQKKTNSSQTTTTENVDRHSMLCS